MTKKQTKIDINPGFEKALKLLENSTENLFITGNAGTGKSTLLEHFKKTTEKKVAVLAPTGVAALNIEGQTIHSFFLIPPNITPDKVLEHKLPEKRRKLVSNLDMIIIDEASMLRADLLDCIDVSLRYHRQEESLPFGGVQMVFIGDLYQLPPVVAGDEEKRLFQSYYNSPYFFSAKSLQDLEFTFLELEKIYRQTDNDFISLLNKVRDNTVSLQDLDLLNQRCDPDCDIMGNKDLTITLTTTNAAADKKNIEELQKLTSSQQTFFGEMDGEFSKRSLPTHLELDLKVGAQVMLLNNDTERRWVNGSIGKIKKITFDDIEMEDVLTIELNTGRSVEIGKHSWRIHKYFFNEDTQKLDTEIAGSFTQFPLRLAWAVTIHKSQGKTFDKVIVDIGRGTFAHGQIYVALSRCTTLGGITLKKPIQKRHIWMDHKITQFFKHLRQERSPQPIDQLPTQSGDYTHQ
ncbi:AAA family ATPase [Candidatus Peregrinibacteria bacterium]|jgi:ATP-dependent DNA helicase PIF1|nr:AAA family ATPase [Candidatus Peregrinibacteria bacterium]MBT4055973.1 AAA family ATPase [Candidatus Peregrinibacteria bacterium]